MKIEVSHHSITDGWKSIKPLVFVADEPKQEQKEVKKEKRKGKKKNNAPTISSKNFGSHLEPVKVKESQMLALAWRCRFLAAIQCYDFGVGDLLQFNFNITDFSYPNTLRLDCSSSDGIKVITPLRPVICLSQPLDLGEASIRLI